MKKQNVQDLCGVVCNALRPKPPLAVENIFLTG